MLIKNILIAGGGHFGKKSIIYGQKKRYRILVIDNNPNCFAAGLVNTTYRDVGNLLEDFENYSAQEIIFLNYDISITLQILEQIRFEYIIPVVPVHLIAQIVKDLFRNNGYELNKNEPLTRKVATKINPDLLLNQIISKGVIYLSYAKENEICPENCSSPPNYCPNHKRNKPITVTDYLKDMFKMTSIYRVDPQEKIIYIIMNSLQLEAGLGGLKGSEIYTLLSNILNTLKTTKIPINQIELIISTSCNCHAVINFYDVVPID